MEVESRAIFDQTKLYHHRYHLCSQILAKQALELGHGNLIESTQRMGLQLHVHALIWMEIKSNYYLYNDNLD